MRLTSLALLALVLFCSSWPITSRAADDPAARLSEDLAPWLDCLVGRNHRFSIIGQASPVIDGQPQPIRFRIDRYDDQAIDIEIEHAKYAVEIRRRAGAIAMALPKHKVVFVGQGEADPADHLAPEGILERLVGRDSGLSFYRDLLLTASAEDLANTLLGVTDLSDSAASHTWTRGDATRVAFSENARHVVGAIDGTHLELKLGLPPETMRSATEWSELTVKQLPRQEIERQLARGIRRACEVLAPSRSLTSPAAVAERVEHGELRWIDGQRVVLLHGTPEEIGTAHGQLLQEETTRCIDSVLYLFGTVQTVASGRWFREDLEAAYARLAPHIPERHLVETRAMARSLELDVELVEAINVFPELFHCSGFALFGKATKDGKLYHGRVLDYMTAIGLQDSATTFIVSVDGYIPFANVGYAGFIGSVSGMNAEKISLGEMGGEGKGKWDGVPMATLMRRALEECRSLAEVKQLWQESPRTCEYYYVFADGEERSAVGVAATPEQLEFVEPGQSDPRLGDGIEDAVVLSAGSRLAELRKRVKARYGQIDATAGQWLMCRPVAMSTNLHNVLFVPEDGVLYIANADHEHPAAERPYVRLDLNELVRSIDAPAAAAETVSTATRLKAHDTLSPAEEPLADSKQCLDGLCWQPESFDVAFEKPPAGRGDWLVRFPSARPSGDATNDTVALEWYQAKDDAGNVLYAPAAVIVHESGSSMTVGRLIAQGLRQHGMHAFMIELPYYGVRRTATNKPKGDRLLAALQQAIADVRRARDAVAAIPQVDATRISLQGTSLGGFVTATTAGLDRGFHRVIIFLAGGDLYGILMAGKQDAAKLRNELQEKGVDDASIKQMLRSIEPLRLAHRIDPERTWMFSGQFDDVVPIENSDMLAKAAGLDESHHSKLLATHYSGIIYLPIILQQMRDIMCQPATQELTP
ncbi:MAG: C45 family autoproteolytic acyltransferase/hydrolase [Aureliella sp.]